MCKHCSILDLIGLISSKKNKGSLVGFGCFESTKFLTGLRLSLTFQKTVEINLSLS